MTESTHDESERSRVRQERDEVPHRKLLVIGVSAIVITCVSLVVSGGILNARIGHVRPRALSEGEHPMPAPTAISRIEQTQIDVARTGLDLRERQRAALENYAIVDRDAGIAAIPIERAFDILIEERSR